MKNDNEQISVIVEDEDDGQFLWNRVGSIIFWLATIGLVAATHGWKIALAIFCTGIALILWNNHTE